MSLGSKTTQTTVADPTFRTRVGQDRAVAEGFQPTSYDPNNRVAGTNDMMRQGLGMIPGAAAAGQPAMNAGIAAATGASQYSPQMIEAAQAAAAAGVPDTQIAEWLRTSGGGGAASARDVNAIDASAKMGQYINPFTNQVVDAALSDLDQQRMQGVTSTKAAAQAAGGFGSSRHGVAEGVLNAQAARAAGGLSAQLRSDAFNTAAGLGAADANRNLQGQMSNQNADVATSTANLNAGMSRFNTMANVGVFNAGQANQVGMFNAGQQNSVAAQNQSAGLQGNAQRLAAGQTLSTQGVQNQQMGLTGADAMLRGGQVDQQIEQAKRNAQYEEFLRKNQEKYLNLNARMATNRQTGSTGTTQESGSALGTVMGVGSMIAGIPGVSGAVSGLLGGGGGNPAAAASGIANSMQYAPSVAGAGTPFGGLPMRGIYDPTTGNY